MNDYARIWPWMDWPVRWVVIKAALRCRKWNGAWHALTQTRFRRENPYYQGWLKRRSAA